MAASCGRKSPAAWRAATSTASTSRLRLAFGWTSDAGLPDGNGQRLVAAVEGKSKRQRHDASAFCTASAAPSLVAPGVDAAPTVAIVRVAAQSVRLVNVVRVAVRIGRVSEYPRHLACGELLCLLDCHEGNFSTLALASGDEAGQHDASRNPQTVYSSHRAPPVRFT